MIIIFTIVLALFIVPSILSFIINSAVYKNMYSMIVDRDSKSKTIDKKMENRRKGQFRDDEEPVAEDYSDLEIDESADGDEFIFYNGKMMKRSYLLKLKKEYEPQAIEAIKSRLMLEAVIKAEKIEATEDEIVEK